MATQLDPHTGSAGILGGPVSQLPGIPDTPQSVSLVDFDFDLGDLPADLLHTIDSVPFFSLAQDQYGTYIKFQSPSVDDYSLRADIRADFQLNVDLNYFIDLGKLDFQAGATSALRLVDNDPQSNIPVPHDPDADVYTNLIVDTSLAGVTLSSQALAPQQDSYATIAVDVHGDLGVVNAGIYDGNTKEWDLGNPFGFSGGYGADFDLFRGRPGDNIANLESGPFRGFVNVPSLPSTLNTVSGGVGAAVYATGSDVEDGPIFANLTFDPITLVPILGQVNSGSFYPLRNYFIDAGVEWKLITADIGANLKLRQSLDVAITSVGVEIDVDEKNHDANDKAYKGNLGDSFELVFTPGDQEDTLITEKYSVTAHVHTDISIVPTLSLDLRLLDFSLIINPILIDEFRTSFNLFNHRFEFEIADIQLVSDGFDITFNTIGITTQIDTHVPVEGTPYNDNGIPYPDGTVYPQLNMAGNQTFVDGLAGDDFITAQDIDSIINGGPDNDHIEGGEGKDLIHAGSGFDSVFGGGGDDIIYADEGGTSSGDIREYILGGLGKDRIFVEASPADVYGGNDNDTVSVKVRSNGRQFLNGGNGFDTLNLDFSLVAHGVSLAITDPGPDHVFIDRNPDELDGHYTGFELVNVVGSTHDDQIYGGLQDETYDGGAGDDLIRGFTGDDLLYGGSGDDTLDGESGDDEIHGGDGIDQISGDIADDVIYGGDGADILDAGSGQDVVFGGNGDDDITDNNADDGEVDNLFGDDGNDTIATGSGGDKAYGGAGDDTFFDRTDNALLYGGDGRDNFYLTGGSHVYGGAGSDTYYLGFFDVAGQADGIYTSGAEIHDTDEREDPGAIFGSTSDDRMVVVGLTSTSHALPDDYELTGFAPDVFLESGVLIRPDGATAATYEGIDSFDLTGTDQADRWLTGRSPHGGGDIMRGMGGDDFLDASDQGQDELYGGVGDDVLVGDRQDLIDGGDGQDTLYWRSSRQAQYISLGDPANGSQTGTGPNGRSITGVERLLMLDAGIGDDKIYGGSGADVLYGGDGDDILAGNGGDDAIVSGHGGDAVSGGEGTDFIDATDMQVVPEDQIETLRVVQVPGQMFPNLLIDHIAYDTVDGGAGDDFILASNTASSVKGGSGSDIIIIQDGGYRGDVVSVIDGGSGNDSLQGSNEAEIFYGGLDSSRALLGNRVRGGLDEHDNIHGGGGDDTIYGGDDDDSLEGGAGTDTLYGGWGDDDLYGTAADELYGEDGDDVLERTGMGPLLVVGAAPPVLLLDGGTGDDIAVFDYTGGRTPIDFTLDHDVMVGNDLHLVGIDAIRATLSDADDTVTGGALNDGIYGGYGRDTLYGGAGDDMLDSGDTRHGDDPVRDLLFGGAGDDAVTVHDMADADGGADEDYLTLRGHNEWFDGVRFLDDDQGAFGPDDQIRYRNFEHLAYSASSFGAAVDVTGGRNRDILFGSEQDDRLSGGGGDDELYGQGGDDTLRVGAVERLARVNGGEGTDLAVIDLSDHEEGVEVTIGFSGPGGPSGPPREGGGEGGGSIEGGGIGPGSSPYAHPVSLLSIERLDVTTGRGEDHVIGGFLNDVIDTGGGDDIVDSAGGSDIVHLGPGNDALVDKGSGVDLFYGEDGADSFDLGGQKATVYGGAGDDVVTITEFFYGLSQFDTPDTVDLGAGDDRLSTNSLGVFKGGVGIDRITTNLSKGGALNLDLTSRDPIAIGAGWSLEGFEQYYLTLGGGNDRVTVEYGLHNLDGGAGEDRLTLRLHDLVDYTTESDGFGGTVYHFANGMVVRGFEHVDFVYSAINLYGGPEANSFTGGDLADHLYGGGGDDVLTGGDGNDVLGGGAGDDKLYGGAGGDFADYSDATTGVRVSLTSTKVQDTGYGKDQLIGIEGLYGSDFADVLTGDGVTNILEGRGGDDQLNGGDGDDYLYGGAGFDRLNGGAGADTMAGGVGNDSYTVDNANDVVIENADEGTDLVSSSATYTLGGNVENLTLTGSANLDGTGNGLANAITGNAGNNRLYGGDGDDSLSGNDGGDLLYGGVGADRLNGGAGIDVMTGGAGADTYTVDNADDEIIEYADEGVDLVSSSVSYALSANLETLVLTGSADLDGIGNISANTIAGNAGANRLYGGGGSDAVSGANGDDFLYGGEGSDNLNGGQGSDRLFGGADSDTLNGGGGADILVGGAGNDAYTVDDAGDQIIEELDEGQDGVTASVSYGLSANVENLVLIGGANLDGTGNGGANAITGNAGVNQLSGLEGDDKLVGNDGADQLFGGSGGDQLSGGNGEDILVGGAGTDLLIGGVGADLFRFDVLETSVNKDSVADFVSGQDRVELSTSVFTGLAGFGLGALDPGELTYGAAATTTAQRLIYNAATGALYYDVDGAGGAGQVQVAVFSTKPALVAGDFILS